MPKRPPQPLKSLSPYVQVLDVCATHRWITELGWDKRGWELSVFEGEELIARGRSVRAPPYCFSKVANTVRLSLEASGRLR